MKVISTDLTSPEGLSPWERDQIYNGLDATMTAEVLSALLPQLDNATASTYAFSRALQGPVLEMRLRGVKVDLWQRQKVLDRFIEKVEVIERNLERIVLEGVGLYHFNWRSNDDLKRLFYDYLQIPPVRKKGVPSVDRNALDKIQAYEIARPICAHLIALKELGKKIGVLKTGIDPDGRIRTSYNIAGTSTGRFSSSFTEFGTGGNLQNIEESLRSILIADRGMKFAKFDAKSGESFCVGAKEWNLFKDGKYLDACETGDPHTAVAKLCWPRLPWTGDLKHDKAVAETPFYRHYTHRFMCKKLGHGSNYGGKPVTLATESHLPIGIVNIFQPLYFGNFPSHLAWQEWVREQLYKSGSLTSLMGRKRDFWGRRNDDSVFREAIAYDPQSSLADIVNTAMLNIWRLGIALVMLQDHDAITFMYPEAREDEVVPELMKHLIVPVPLDHGRELRIPYDAKVGWNRGEYCCGDRTKPGCKDCRRESNPDGLKDYTPGDKRRRTAEIDILDRRVC